VLTHIVKDQPRKDQRKQQNIKRNNLRLFLRKFIKPFVITYIFLSIALGFYPNFDFYTFKGQLLIISVACFNGVLGIYIKKL
jgi:hypothetical protein